MSTLQRATLALLGGGTQIAQTFLGGSTDEAPPRKFNNGVSPGIKRSSSLRSSESGSVKSSSSRTQRKSAMLVSRPVEIPRPVTQADYVDAVTAALTGDTTMLSKDNADDDEDMYSLSSVSTLNSHVELSSPPSESPKFAHSLNQNIGMGQMFFFLDQKNPSVRDVALPVMTSSSTNGLTSETSSLPPSMTVSQTVTKESSIVETKDFSQDIKHIPITHQTHVTDNEEVVPSHNTLDSHVTISENSDSSIVLPQSPQVDQETNLVDDEEPTYFGRSVSSLRAMIEAKTKEADQECLFERGCKSRKHGKHFNERNRSKNDLCN
jgi:hypothetical protein